MQFEYIGYFLLSILGLYILIKVFSWPIKMLFNLACNAVLGIILLVTANFVGHYFNFSIGINLITVFVAGILGIPGLGFLIIFKLFL